MNPTKRRQKGKIRDLQLTHCTFSSKFVKMRHVLFEKPH